MVEDTPYLPMLLGGKPGYSFLSQIELICLGPMKQKVFKALNQFYSNVSYMTCIKNIKRKTEISSHNDFKEINKYSTQINAFKMGVITHNHIHLSKKIKTLRYNQICNTYKH